MSFEFGIFHEFARYAGQTDAEVFAQSFAQVDAAERFGLDVVWLAELHFLPERSVASAPLLLASAIAAANPSLENRHCGASAAAVPPIAIGGGGRNARSRQRWTPHFRRRSQRLSAHLRGLWGALRREPRSLRRGARDPRALLDARSASPSREASTTFAISRSSRGRCRSHIRRCASRRRARTPIPRSAPWAFPFSSPCASAPSRSWVPTSRPIARPTGPPVTRGKARSICGCRSTSARQRPRRGPTPSTPSCRSTGRSEPSSRSSATRAGARASEQRAERGQALQTIGYEDVLRDKVIVGHSGFGDDTSPGADRQARSQRRPGGAQLRRSHRQRQGHALAAAHVRGGRAAVPVGGEQDGKSISGARMREMAGVGAAAEIAQWWPLIKAANIRIGQGK